MRKNRKRKNNLFLYIVLFILLIVLAIGGIIYFWLQANNYKKQLEQVNTELNQTSNEKKSTCVDSDINEKPNDIYIKGTVTSTSNGIKTIVSDECSGSYKQINEMWCYESPSGSGNYVIGKMVYNCRNGCFNGACIK